MCRCLQVTNIILATSLGNQCMESNFANIFDCPDKCVYHESRVLDPVCAAVVSSSGFKKESTCSSRPPCTDPEAIKLGSSDFDAERAACILIAICADDI
jgi:hypothetical protein